MQHHLKDIENLDGIPPLWERQSLLPGELAKVVFLVDHDAEFSGERMWVEVEQRLDNGGYVGRLDNDPYVLEGILKCNDQVRFRPENVLVIYAERLMS